MFYQICIFSSLCVCEFFFFFWKALVRFFFFGRALVYLKADFRVLHLYCRIKKTKNKVAYQLKQWSFFFFSSLVHKALLGVEDAGGRVEDSK